MTYVNIDPPLPHEWPGTATEPKPTPTGSQPSPGPGTTDSTPQWNIYPVDSVQPTNPIIPIDLEQPLPYLWPTSGGGSHYEVKINVNQLMN
ncbi:hypothetical protein [Microtetraspora fusca]|nr:hypothetical protein [Microtetraspora fusca]